MLAASASLVVFCLMLTSCGGSEATVGRQVTPQDFTGAVLTYHNDNTRTGQRLTETALTLASVNPTHFGKLFSYPVDGAIYGQPLYVANVPVPGQGVHNVVYVTTEHDSVYAWDADGLTNSPLWHVNFLNPGFGVTSVPWPDVQCDNIVPEIGITGTPVIDPDTHAIYLVAVTKEPSGYFSRLHALDLATGAETLGGPVIVSPAVAGVGDDTENGIVRFNAQTHNQRAGLLLLNGVVYVTYGAHCDFEPTHGWVVGFDAATLAQRFVFNTNPDGGLGDIWMSGAAPSADSDGNIYLGTGNDTFCFPDRPSNEFGDSVLKLSADLSLKDFFTPFNFLDLCNNDEDVGATGIILLPDQPGSHPHVMVTASKEGRLYVLDRDNLGKFDFTTDQVIQSVPNFFPAVEVHGTGTYWNGHLYYAVEDDVVKDFPVTNGMVSTTPAFQDTQTLPFPGATPTISANNANDAILWIVVGTGLRAYDATNVSKLLFTSDPAALTDSKGGVKFVLPTVANGKVYFGTKTQLMVFGLTGQH